MYSEIQQRLQKKLVRAFNGIASQSFTKIDLVAVKLLSKFVPWKKEKNHVYIYLESSI